MERELLPYVDAHEVEIAADPEAIWRELTRVGRGMLGGPGGGWLGRALGVEPHEAVGAWGVDLVRGTALPGFTVAEVRRPELLSLRGRHRLSRYRLDFELALAADGDPARTRLRAVTWAEFPGLAGKAYRAAVIGSGGHARVVRRMLGRIADSA